MLLLLLLYIFGEVMSSVNQIQQATLVKHREAIDGDIMVHDDNTIDLGENIQLVGH
jgi:hypothetical protein